MKCLNPSPTGSLLCQMPIGHLEPMCGADDYLWPRVTENLPEPMALVPVRADDLKLLQELFTAGRRMAQANAHGWDDESERQQRIIEKIVGFG